MTLFVFSFFIIRFCLQWLRAADEAGYSFIHSFIHSFGLNNKVQEIKVTKTLTYVLGLNTKHQPDIVR